MADENTIDDRSIVHLYQRCDDALAYYDTGIDKEFDGLSPLSQGDRIELLAELTFKLAHSIESRLAKLENI